MNILFQVIDQLQNLVLRILGRIRHIENRTRGFYIKFAGDLSGDDQRNQWIIGVVGTDRDRLAKGSGLVQIRSDANCDLTGIAWVYFSLVRT